MKFELEVLKFDINDVITTSNGSIPGCANPNESVPFGDAPETCPDGFVG